jgi:predicted nuclease of restriction endonuclease-like RecB superfamily
VLTSDLVQAREKGGELVLARETPERTLEIVRLVDAYLEIARAGLGESRAAIEDAWGEVPFQAKHARLAAGARKLVEDGCTFAAATGADPVALRRALFERAARARLDRSDAFDRRAILEEAAREAGMTPDEVERALFSDLRQREILKEVFPTSGADIARGWRLAEIEAVLLRAADLDVELTEGSPAAFRALFRTLRFRGLLFRIERAGKGYRLRIDGPFSLFESVTKYGLALALAMRDIAGCEAWKLVARLRWGRDRHPVIFRAEGGRPAGPTPRKREIENAVARRLAREINAEKGPWRAKRADVLFDVPGAGVVVPDLVLERGKGERVFVELLGFWSRAAVWNRVEMVERGLLAPVVFVAAKKLRVKEEVMPEDAPASLYVHATEPSARKLVARAEALIARLSP